MSLKNILRKAAVSAGLAGGILLCWAISASAEVVPVACYPSENGGQYEVWYDTESETSAIILVE